jgi:nicotinamidase-related amidase
MKTLSIDVARTALILIDLQHSNVARSLAPYSGEQVVGNCVLLAQEMRERGGLVVYVRVLVNELLALPADAPLSGPVGATLPPPNASQLVPEAGVEAADLVITKRQWGAFYGTELDQALRRRHINTIVIGGIATNYGVESTARAAFDRGYALVLVEDAMTSMSAEAHAFACQNTFRHMGYVRKTADVIDALQAGTGEA